MTVPTIHSLVPYDSLSRFLKIYFAARPVISVPLRAGLSFLDGIAGVVLHRTDHMQVQLFICQPHVEIPDHQHPNIDSFEVALFGMRFRHAGMLVLSEEQDLQDNGHGCSMSQHNIIRVNPSDSHGGTAGPDGGAFISVQQWLNGVVPTSVEHDWDGELVGPQHRETVNQHRVR